MSKVKDQAIVSAAQASTAYSQIDSFSHLYDRGGTLTATARST
jgi:serralysin